MKRKIPVFVTVVATLLAWACAGDGGGSRATTPAPTTGKLSGRVTSALPTGPGTPIFVLLSATLTIVDGPNAGRTASMTTGQYEFLGLQLGGFTVNVSVPGYRPQGFGVTLTGDLTRDFALASTSP